MLKNSIVDKGLEYEEPGFIFHNYLGLTLQLAIHDDFVDDNLERVQLKKNRFIS